MKDPDLTFPDMWFSVYLTGSSFEQRQFTEMFVRGKCRRAATPEEADLVVFAGGEDVNPVLYGEIPHSKTQISMPRDDMDMALYTLCADLGIPMVGICRGAQFLSVMNGGKLYQDVDGHYGDHAIFDLRNKKVIPCISSVHHQMVMDNTAGGMEILAIAGGKSQVRHKNPTVREEGTNKDIEAFFYRETCSIGIQGHPEYRGYPQFMNWALTLINDLLGPENPDLGWIDNPNPNIPGKSLRMKPDLVRQREAAKAEKKKEAQ